MKKEPSYTVPRLDAGTRVEWTDYSACKPKQGEIIAAVLPRQDPADALPDGCTRGGGYGPDDRDHITYLVLPDENTESKTVLWGDSYWLRIQLMQEFKTVLQSFHMPSGDVVVVNAIVGDC